MQFDYDSILAELKSRLSLLSNWTRTLFYGIYDNILGAVSYGIEKLAYKAGVFYRESIWSTAQYKKSLIKQAKWISYTPYRKIGASGTVEVSADSNLSATYTYTGDSVPIDKWTQLSNEAGDVFVYVTTDAIYYKNTVGTTEISVKEGEVKTYTYTASGTENETIEIFDDSIEEEYIQVDIVDATGTVLYPVYICGEDDVDDKLYFITDLDNYYCEITNADDFQSVKIQFGDDIYGKKLPAGALVKVTYAQTNGDDGDITNTGVITKFVDTLYDGNGVEATLYATNTDEISNGDDVESFDHIQNYGPRLFVSGYRCGSYDDWKTILENHSYIRAALVSNMDEIGYTATAYRNKVFVTAISTDGSTLTDAQKAVVAAYLKDDNYKSVTEILEWLDPETIYVFPRVSAWIENEPYATVTTLIEDAVEENYSSSYADFQTNINESNFINVIDDLDYITFHESEIYHLEKNWAAQVSEKEIAVSYTSDDTDDEIDQIYLQADTIELWLKRKTSGTWGTPFQIASVVSGTLTGLSGDLGGSGSIASSYTINNFEASETANAISYTIQTIIDNPVEYGTQNPSSSGTTGYIVSVAYQTQDGNGNQQGSIRLPLANFITDFDSEYETITLEYV